MKIQVKVGEKKPYPFYMPTQLVKEGFKGDVDVYVNAVTITIVKPGTSLEDIEKSLKIILDDLALRKAQDEPEWI